jgi:hypothetical protein
MTFEGRESLCERGLIPDFLYNQKSLSRGVPGIKGVACERDRSYPMYVDAQRKMSAMRSLNLEWLF